MNLPGKKLFSAYHFQHHSRNEILVKIFYGSKIFCIYFAEKILIKYKSLLMPAALVLILITHF